MEKNIFVVVVRYGFRERETTPSLDISYLLNILNVTKASVEYRYCNFIVICPTTN